MLVQDNDCGNFTLQVLGALNSNANKRLQVLVQILAVMLLHDNLGQAAHTQQLLDVEINGAKICVH